MTTRSVREIVQVRSQMQALSAELIPYATENVTTQIRNAVRFQGVPEKQKNLARATITLNMDANTFFQVPGSDLAQLIGDREQTYERRFTSASEMAALWGGDKPNGYVIPEKLADKRGAKKARLFRNRGYMIIMMHGLNKYSWCQETKLFTLTLALAFFGENLQFVTGEPPPAPPADLPSGAEYDLVSGEHVVRADAPAWTVARARAFLGEY